MPTALVQIYTSDGFILGADGREVDNESLQVLTDDRQKIFRIGDSPIACSVMGCTVLGEIGAKHDVVLFDAFAQLAEHTVNAKYSTVEDCARDVSWMLYRDLKRACNDPRIDLPMDTSDTGLPGSEIFCVSFHGYSENGIPGSFATRFYHEGREVREPQIMKKELGRNRYGSDMVEHELMVGRRFDWLKAPPSASCLQSSRLLNEAIHDAVVFIKACSSREAQEIDPKHCLAIGGRIHIASVTPRTGLRWIKGFEPISSSPTASPQP